MKKISLSKPVRIIGICVLIYFILFVISAWERRNDRFSNKEPKLNLIIDNEKHRDIVSKGIWINEYKFMKGSLPGGGVGQMF